MTFRKCLLLRLYEIKTVDELKFLYSSSSFEIHDLGVWIYISDNFLGDQNHNNYHHHHHHQKNHHIK